MIRIRSATRKDLAQILAIEGECFPEHPFTPRQFRHYFRGGGSIFLIAEAGGPAPGYIAGSVDRRFKEPTARLDSIAVVGKDRGRGVGAALLEKFEAGAAAQGCRAVVLQVSVRNAAALRLYESFGYEKTASLPDYYGQGQHAAQMMKRLSSGGDPR